MDCLLRVQILLGRIIERIISSGGSVDGKTAKNRRCKAVEFGIAMGQKLI